MKVFGHLLQTLPPSALWRRQRLTKAGWVLRAMSKIFKSWLVLYMYDSEGNYITTFVLMSKIITTPRCTVACILRIRDTLSNLKCRNKDLTYWIFVSASITTKTQVYCVARDMKGVAFSAMRWPARVKMTRAQLFFKIKVTWIHSILQTIHQWWSERQSWIEWCSCHVKPKQHQKTFMIELGCY